MVRTLIPPQGTTGLIPGRGTNVACHMAWPKKTKKKLGGGYTGSVLFLTTSCKSIIISKL